MIKDSLGPATARRIHAAIADLSTDGKNKEYSFDDLDMSVLNDHLSELREISKKGDGAPTIFEVVDALVHWRKMWADVEKFREERRKEGLAIVSETAEVECFFADIYDPYGLTGGIVQVGRELWARDPGAEHWVNEGDLPAETVKALGGRNGSKYREALRKDREAAGILSPNGMR